MEFPFLRFAHGETIDMLPASVRDFAAREIAPRALPAVEPIRKLNDETAAAIRTLAATLKE